MNILAVGFSHSPFFKEVQEKAQKRGHRMDFCTASSVVSDVSNEQLSIRSGELDLENYDVIHVGSLSQNRWPLTAVFGYLGRTTSCAIIDDRLVSATLDEYSGSAKYFLEHEHGIALPRSIVFKRTKSIKKELTTISYPMVIKTNSSKQGRGVGLVHSEEDITAFVRAHLTENPKGGFVLREYIPNDGDYRVNIVDGEAVIVLKRTPQPGEFRSNISLGGSFTNVPVEEVPEVVEAAKKIVALSNYDIAGVDVMVHKETDVPYVLEVNRAPGGLEDDAKASRVDLANMFIDLYEKRVRAKKPLFSKIEELFS